MGAGTVGVSRDAVRSRVGEATGIDEDCDEGAKVTRSVETVFGMPSLSRVTVSTAEDKTLYGPFFFFLS